MMIDTTNGMITIVILYVIIIIFVKVSSSGSSFVNQLTNLLIPSNSAMMQQFIRAPIIKPAIIYNRIISIHPLNNI